MADRNGTRPGNLSLWYIVQQQEKMRNVMTAVCVWIVSFKEWKRTSVTQAQVLR